MFLLFGNVYFLENVCMWCVCDHVGCVLCVSLFFCFLRFLSRQRMTHNQINQWIILSSRYVTPIEDGNFVSELFQYLMGPDQCAISITHESFYEYWFVIYVIAFLFVAHCFRGRSLHSIEIWFVSPDDAEWQTNSKWICIIIIWLCRGIEFKLISITSNMVMLTTNMYSSLCVVCVCAGQ